MVDYKYFYEVLLRFLPKAKLFRQGAEDANGAEIGLGFFVDAVLRGKDQGDLVVAWN